MQTSKEGIARIEHREGVRLQMYYDSAGLPTIGVGHLLTKDELSSGKLFLSSGPAKWRDGITKEQVDDLLTADLHIAESVVDVCLAQRPDLPQCQFDCLVSFVFNIGGKAFRNSTLLKKLLACDFAAIPDELRKWKYAGGVVSPGLVKRREDEVKQWLGY